MRKRKTAPLILTLDERERLKKITGSRTVSRREIERAEVLLRYADGQNIVQISQEARVSRPTVYKCIGKALAMGVEAGLKDTYHRPFAPVITQEAKAWVVPLACNKPKDYGYAAELWTRSSLAKHVCLHSKKEGHPSLSWGTSDRKYGTRFTTSFWTAQRVEPRFLFSDEACCHVVKTELPKGSGIMEEDGEIVEAKTDNADPGKGGMVNTPAGLIFR